MNLNVREFPNDLHKQLQSLASQKMVPMRDLVIQGLRFYVASVQSPNTRDASQLRDECPYCKLTHNPDNPCRNASQQAVGCTNVSHDEVDCNAAGLPATEWCDVCRESAAEADQERERQRERQRLREVEDSGALSALKKQDLLKF